MIIDGIRRQKETETSLISLQLFEDSRTTNNTTVHAV